MTAKPPDLTKMSAPAPAAQFAEHAIARGIAIDKSKPGLGNKHFDAFTRIYVELKSRGIDAQRALLPLLGHSDPEVRLNAATLALEFAPSLSTPVLRALLPLHGFLAFQARGALKR